MPSRIRRILRGERGQGPSGDVAKLFLFKMIEKAWEPQAVRSTAAMAPAQQCEALWPWRRHSGAKHCLARLGRVEAKLFRLLLIL